MTAIDDLTTAASQLNGTLWRPELDSDLTARCEAATPEQWEAAAEQRTRPGPLLVAAIHVAAADEAITAIARVVAQSEGFGNFETPVHHVVEHAVAASRWTDSHMHAIDAIAGTCGTTFRSDQTVERDWQDLLAHHSRALLDLAWHDELHVTSSIDPRTLLAGPYWTARMWGPYAGAARDLRLLCQFDAELAATMCDPHNPDQLAQLAAGIADSPTLRAPGRLAIRQAERVARHNADLASWATLWLRRASEPDLTSFERLSDRHQRAVLDLFDDHTGNLRHDLYRFARDLIDVNHPAARHIPLRVLRDWDNLPTTTTDTAGLCVTLLNHIVAGGHLSDVHRQLWEHWTGTAAELDTVDQTLASSLTAASSAAQ